MPARQGEATAAETADANVTGEPAPEAKTPEAEAVEDAVSGDALEEKLAAGRQRKLRLLLRQCDRVLLLDFNILAMPDWPDNYTVATARRRRDLWLFSACLTALIFLSGMTGFVPAWVAGGGFGAFVMILLAGVPFIRRLYSDQDSYVELMMLRHRLLKDARKHIEHLEGKAGLIWQCAQMVEFNPALKSVRFRRLLELSEQHMLARALTRREYIRMYLIYMLESEKAYNSLQQAFFEGNQAAIDAGWESVAAEAEPRA